MQIVDVGAISPDRLTPAIGPQRHAAFQSAAAELAQRLRGRSVWNVSSTATGGGVAEMLEMLVAYGIGAGVQTGWLVVDGDPEFFATTKRIHNRLHGSPGDGGELGSTQRNHYQSVLETNLPEMLEVVRPGDVVILHDPQTAGLTHALVGYGAHVIWRCHVGSDITNAHTDQAWSFLRPYCESAHGLVFSRRQYTPDWVDPERLAIIAPAIDPFSLKNVDLDPAVVTAALARVGILADGSESEQPTFRRGDGTPATVSKLAEIVREGGPLPAEMPLVVQVSRWDRLKDMAGVLTAFAHNVLPAFGVQDVHLVLVGPSVAGVMDDPEGQQVLSECIALWKSLPIEHRRRISLVSLPTQDVEENAVVVNAIQRHASIVVQKSLVEGFGLTVAEALWKSRPMVASAVGGILDQITNEEHGLLIADPADLTEFGAAVTRLLQNRAEAARFGAAGRVRVTEEFLPDRELRQWAQLISRVDVAIL